MNDRVVMGVHSRRCARHMKCDERSSTAFLHKEPPSGVNARLALCLYAR